mmetsp:Transcript_60809/g.130696  ORF Transcript_60809/g.130696 Transcript_60809/m.130696 type:complete len:302 (+) Transcript_60809:403-1308(+)
MRTEEAPQAVREEDSVRVDFQGPVMLPEAPIMVHSVPDLHEGHRVQPRVRSHALLTVLARGTRDLGNGYGHELPKRTIPQRQRVAIAEDGVLITSEDARPLGQLGLHQLRLVAYTPHHREAEQGGPTPILIGESGDSGDGSCGAGTCARHCAGHRRRHRRDGGFAVGARNRVGLSRAERLPRADSTAAIVLRVSGQPELEAKSMAALRPRARASIVAHNGIVAQGRGDRLASDIVGDGEHPDVSTRPPGELRIGRPPLFQLCLSPWCDLNISVLVAKEQRDPHPHSPTYDKRALRPRLDEL